MFNKNGYKLKSSFRKMLMSTNEIYHYSISPEEVQSIGFMWTKLMKDNSFIWVSRFLKQRNCLGIRISTNFKEDKYEHVVKDVVNNTDVSQNTKIAVDDILLEVNGINVTQLNYSELAILLSSLPINVQLVYAKKENEYEKLDASSEERNLSPTEFDDRWMHPITIIVQGSRKVPDGLDFINNPGSPKIISKCVIQKIKPTGYCYLDKRISVNDSIVKLNNINVQMYSENDMYKLLQNKKNPVLMMTIGKYKTCKSITHVDFSIFPRNQSASLENVTDKNNSLPKQKSISQIITPFQSKDYPSETDVPDDVEILSINIENNDDCGIYLVDLENKKTIICGFHEKSKLKNKFHIGDEIIKINDQFMTEWSSLKIGKLIKSIRNQMEIVTVTISRSLKPRRLINSIIIPSEMKHSSANIKNDSVEKPLKIDENYIIFNVTIPKINNSFGLYIQNCNGPTINAVLPNSELYQNDQVRTGDKIIRINDIYVADKDREFVLTLIRSCGQNMKLEISRSTENRLNIEYTNNPIYYLHSDTEANNKNTMKVRSEQTSPNIPKIRENYSKYIKTM